MTTVVQCGRLFDGTGADPVSNVTLVVEDGFLRDGPAPAGADVIDLSDRFVMPGLVDAHTHLSIIPGKGNQMGQLREPPGKQALRVAGNVRKDLDAGTTTLRIMGEEDWLDVHARQAVDEGDLEGPRLSIATRGLASGSGLDSSAYAPEEMRVIVEGAERKGTYVAAHAHGGPGLRAAAEAGVRTIEHAAVAAPEDIDCMLRHGCWV